MGKRARRLLCGSGVPGLGVLLPRFVTRGPLRLHVYNGNGNMGLWVGGRIK